MWSKFAELVKAAKNGGDVDFDLNLTTRHEYIHMSSNEV